MNAKSLILGIVGTVVWLLIIFLFAVLKGYELPNSLNELGDALAGIVAPIAFFWLILGYVQQGKQLDQNTKALEQQEKALNLQIVEMKESVKQQTELAKIQRDQFEALNSSINPSLEIENFKYIKNKEVIIIPRGDFIEQLERGERLEFEINNKGNGPAHNICIRRSDDSKCIFQIMKIDKNKSDKVLFDFSDNALEILKKNKKYEIEFFIEYKNSYERRFSSPKYRVEIYQIIDGGIDKYAIEYYSIRME